MIGFFGFGLFVWDFLFCFVLWVFVVAVGLLIWFLVLVFLMGFSVCLGGVCLFILLGFFEGRFNCEQFLAFLSSPHFEEGEMPRKFS